MATSGRGEPTWIRLNIQLRPEQHEWLRRIAYERRTTIAALIRLFVDDARLRLEPQQELPWETGTGRASEPNAG